MEHPHDDRLLKAIDGDADALSALLQESAPALRASLVGKIGNVWQASLDVDDIMQVTYLEAFLRISSFKPSTEGGFVAWLRRIADNNLKDAIRELGRAKRPNPKRRVTGATREESYAAFVDAMGYTSHTPSRDAAGGEAVNAMKQAMTRLPADYRRVLELYDLDGRSPAEVAAEMGRSEGAVFMLRARAQDRLRELMGSTSNYFSAPA